MAAAGRGARGRDGSTPAKGREPRWLYDPSEILQLYEQGWTNVRIAREMGCSPMTVAGALREHGIRRRRRYRPVLGKVARKLLDIWYRMRASCLRRTHPGYPEHGGRGVRVDPAWDRSEDFARWARGAGYRAGLVLHRRDARDDFSPANCVWITPSERARRRRLPPPRVFLTAFGETKGLLEWTRDPRCRIDLKNLAQRVRRGFEPELALTAPAYSVRGSKRAPAVRARKQRRIDRAAVARLFARGWTAPRVAREIGASHVGVWLVAKQLGVHRDGRGSGDPELRLLRHRWHSMRFLAERDDHGVCKAWRRFEAFAMWARAAGFRPELNLARIDKVRGYSPENCRWVERGDAWLGHYGPRKAPSPRKPVRAFGIEKSLLAWSRDPRCKVVSSTLHSRIRNGWRPEDAISTPGAFSGGEGRWRHPVEAFGTTKGVTAWASDPRCRVTGGTLLKRLEAGLPPELAITAPPYAVSRAARAPVSKLLPLRLRLARERGAGGRKGSGAAPKGRRRAGGRAGGGRA